MQWLVQMFGVVVHIWTWHLCVVSIARPRLEVDLATCQYNTVVGPDVGGACEHLDLGSECGLPYTAPLGDIA